MILGVWQLLAAFAMVTTLFAIAEFYQRPMSLLGMATWVFVAFGATNLEMASNGQMLSNPDPTVAILGFVGFAFCLVFFGASFAKSEDGDEDNEELMPEASGLRQFSFGRSP